MVPSGPSVQKGQESSSLMVMDMGQHVVQDYAQPLTLHQVMVPGLEDRARAFPRLSTARQLSPGTTGSSSLELPQTRIAVVVVCDTHSFIHSFHTFSSPRVRYVQSRVRLSWSSCLGSRHTNCTASLCHLSQLVKLSSAHKPGAWRGRPCLHSSPLA